MASMGAPGFPAIDYVPPNAGWWNAPTAGTAVSGTSTFPGHGLGSPAHGYGSGSWRTSLDFVNALLESQGEGAGT